MYNPVASATSRPNVTFPCAALKSHSRACAACTPSETMARSFDEDETSDKRRKTTGVSTVSCKCPVSVRTTSSDQSVAVSPQTKDAAMASVHAPPFQVVTPSSVRAYGPTSSAPAIT